MARARKKKDEEQQEQVEETPAEPTAEDAPPAEESPAAEETPAAEEAPAEEAPGPKTRSCSSRRRERTSGFLYIS